MTADLEDKIFRNLSHTVEVIDAVRSDPGIIAALVEIINLCITAIRRGNKILLVGNGGSAADAQHIAAEIVGRFSVDRPGMPAIALTTDSSVLTSIANDYGFEMLFSRQVEALGKAGDVLIAFSTSGKSGNIIESIHAARRMDINTVGFTGANGAEMSALCDKVVCVPSDDTARIQEAHITMGHIVCAFIEQAMYE
jgi:D-sedoheptulose 7-phosphate isomerase